MSLNIAELDSHCCPVSPLRPRPTASRLFPNGTVDRSSHCWTRLFIIDSFKFICNLTFFSVFQFLSCPLSWSVIISNIPQNPAHGVVGTPAASDVQLAIWDEK